MTAAVTGASRRGDYGGRIRLKLCRSKESTMNPCCALTLLSTLLLASPARAATVPAPLQGQWEYGHVSPIEYYDPSSGKYAEGSGTSEIIRINADGTYTRSGIIVVTTYNCTSKLLTTSRGTVKIEGSRLTFMPTAVHNKGYTCSSSRSYETRDLRPSVFTWKLTGDTLILGDPKGEARDSRYNRPRTPGASAAEQTIRRVTGVLTVPETHTGASVAVIACRVDRGCGVDDGSVRIVNVTGGGRQRSFSLDHLDGIPYEILAWEDTNGNGTPDAGDWVDAASARGQSGLTVTPPTTQVFLTLEEWR